jgi:hypothetical protein
MNEIFTCQGKAIHQSDLLWLKAIVNDNPDWSQHQITKKICDHWNWHTQTGQLKTLSSEPKFPASFVWRSFMMLTREELFVLA